MIVELQDPVPNYTVLGSLPSGHFFFKSSRVLRGKTPIVTEAKPAGEKIYSS